MLFREWLRFVASTPIELRSNANERRVRTIDTILRVLHHIHQHEVSFVFELCSYTLHCHAHNTCICG
jgi:hypothetical protein